MNHYQLYLKEPNHLLFSQFGKALMQAYKLATIGDKSKLADAFPTYFKEEIDPKILRRLSK